jgi:two-component system, NarL family, sensor kinase
MQNMETLKMNHEKNLLKTQVEIQEQTFRNISQEIHDNINLSLTLAKLNLYMLGQGGEEKTSDGINRSIGLIGNAINDLTAISRGLNSEVICQQGLIRALQQEIDRIGRNTALNIHLVISGEPVYLDSARELFIFRIVQEAFNNIIKHAEARVVELRLGYDCARIDVTITDDGKGFKQELLGEKAGSAGLTNIRTRTKWFNGSFSLQSEEKAGTQLFITIPYDRTENN